MKIYRPISLLSFAYMIFTMVIANRISTTLDFNQPNYQAGFLKVYSTIENVSLY